MEMVRSVRIFWIAVMLAIAVFMFVSCEGLEGLLDMECDCGFTIGCDCSDGMGCSCEFGIGCVCDYAPDYGIDPWYMSITVQ